MKPTQILYKITKDKRTKLQIQLDSQIQDNLAIPKTRINDERSNSMTVKDLTVPKINHSRNFKRFNSTLNALHLFIDTNFTHLTPASRGQLGTFSYKLSVLHEESPARFLKEVKLLTNWMKVNLPREQFSQDNIPDHMWSTTYNRPSLLLDALIHLNSIPSQMERTQFIRGLFSFLELFNVITVPTDPNLSSITAEATSNLDRLSSYDLDGAIASLGISPIEFSSNLKFNTENLKWHVSSASGPNGQALWMSHIDSKAIWNDEIVKANLDRYCSINKIDFMGQLEDSFRLPNFFKVSQNTPLHSKLHLIFEKGNKCRIIAILDYWTQQALCPLHDTIQSEMKKLNEDGTFDQDKLVERIRSWTLSGDKDLYSLDLTAATDRLPVKFQCSILDKLTGVEGYGEAWALLLTDRDFDLVGHKLRYSVGQPMGAKTSFPMLALTHHIIVQMAAIKCGIQNFKDYVILGDDICIANKSVAEEYIIIMEILGMEISLPKSIISLKSNSEHAAEIARRYFVNGRDLSPLPAKLFATVLENQDMADQLQEELHKRSFIDNRSNLLDFYSGILNDQSLLNIIFLNGLPSVINGMKSSFPFIEYPKFNFVDLDKHSKFSTQTIIEFFCYCIITEQLKRANTILKNTSSTYETIIKSANVTQTVGIGSPEFGYLPVENFTEEEMSEWDIVNTFHPAVEAVKNEVDRINELLMSMVSADTNSKHLLMSKLVDALKISSFETSPDKAFVSSKLTRKLVQQTMRVLQNSLQSKDGIQNFSVKLNRLNVLWYVRVSLNTPCTLSRTFSKIISFKSEAHSRNLIKQNKFSNSTPFDSF